MRLICDSDSEREPEHLPLEFYFDLQLPTCPGSDLQIGENIESVLCYCGTIFCKGENEGIWELPNHKEKRVKK